MLLADIMPTIPALSCLLLILVYAALGGSIKYIDDAFDEHTFSAENALLLAPVAGILWALTMLISPASATILLAIVLSVLLRGKIDNIAHRIGLITVILLVFVSGYASFLWLPLVFIASAGIVDEAGHDLFGEEDYRPAKPPSRFLHYFFKYRCAMKIAVFAFVVLGFFEWVYFFAFMGFEIAYMLVMWHSAGLKQRFIMGQGAITY